MFIRRFGGGTLLSSDGYLRRDSQRLEAWEAGDVVGCSNEHSHAVMSYLEEVT